MYLKTFNMLQCFAEEGAASGGTQSNSGDAGQNTEGTVPVTERGANKVKVLYGKQPDLTDAEGAEDPSAQAQGAESENNPDSADREREYDEFINAHKDIHTRKQQKLFNKRFREQKNLEEKLSKYEEKLSKYAEIEEVLNAKYGTNDLDSLSAKLRTDNKLFSDEAEALGMDEEQYANYMRMKIKAQKYDAMQRQSAEAEKNRRFNERLAKEENEMREILPDFSLRDEIEASPEFVRMLKSGVSVKAAYNAIHNDEITAAAIKHAQAAAAKATAENVRARGNRPRENGNGNAPGVIIKSDVSRLTRAERADVARRTLAGEKISF